MNQEKTKHKFHEVLKWVADGEEIEYKNDFDKWVSTLNEDVLSVITCAGNSYCTIDRFRIKPEPQIVHADVTYVVFGTSGNCTVDLSCENTETKQMLFKMAQQRERVVILSEECYNEFVSCKEQLDKLKF